jgi:hypothetical protein
MPRGSKPGERRGGRREGTLNRVTAANKGTLSEIARIHTVTALETLVAVMNDPAAPAAARVTAASSLLDRGYGKPRQTHELSGLMDRSAQYVIRDRPMTEDEWATERAEVKFLDQNNREITKEEFDRLLAASEKAKEIANGGDADYSGGEAVRPF